MSRIGVFICHCGLNIAGTVDVERAAQSLRVYPGVALATTYRYMCSDPGQTLIRDAIVKNQLDGIVVAACSPAMHETTFRRAAAGAGLNPYRCEIANIREQCSWVHQHDQDAATEKAIGIIASLVEKAKADAALSPLSLPLVKRALVIGGGIAGMQAALDVAAAGYCVVLVERQGRLGGKMALQSGTYLNFRSSSELLASVIDDVTANPNITVYTGAEVDTVSGYVGNFSVRLKPALPADVGRALCPTPGRDDSPGSMPGLQDGRPAGEGDAHATTAAVGRALCPTPASEAAEQPRATGAPPLPPNPGEKASASPKLWGEGRALPAEPLDVGAIVVATGFDLYPKQRLAEYGAGKLPDVVDGMEFEAMLASPEGLRRPSDGATPREVVFVQCAGSRDTEHGVPYCSKICCMVTAKQAMMFRQRTPGGQAYVFYIDIRAPGRGNDEFVQQAMASGVLYLRGKVSRLFAGDSKTMVWGADTLSGRSVEIAADLVVLATPMVPSVGASSLAQRLHIAADGFGFYSEAHPKLRPVESLTAGVYLAGAGQAPKDIPESIAQAGGAAAKVLSLFSRDKMVQEPTVAVVSAELCAACGQCVGACPYGARLLHEWKRMALVNEALCQGCGACIVACPNKATQLRNTVTPQVLAMADALLWG